MLHGFKPLPRGAETNSYVPERDRNKEAINIGDTKTDTAAKER